MTEKIEIDGTYALSLLTEVVQEAGKDYIYPRGEIGACRYEHNGQPACIVGRVLAKAGVSARRLKNLDAVSANGPTISRLFYDGYLRKRGIELTIDAMQIFQAAQYRQDDGETWGAALKAAQQVQ